MHPNITIRQDGLEPSLAREASGREAYDCPLGCGARIAKLEEINLHIDAEHKDQAINFQRAVLQLLTHREWIPVPFSKITMQELGMLKEAVVDGDAKIVLVPFER